MANAKFVPEKAREITFALIRVSGFIKRKLLRQKIEQLSYELLASISSTETNHSILVVDSLIGFVRLSRDLYEIETVNSKILIRELEALTNELRRGTENSELPDLEKLFTVQIPISKTKPISGNGKPGKTDAKLISGNIPEMKSKFPEMDPQEVVISDHDESIVDDEEWEISGNDSDLETRSVRQEKLLSLFRNAPNNRLYLKDIEPAFPEVSGRTIRGDLKQLADAGTIERQGSGGPSNYYQMS